MAKLRDKKGVSRMSSKKFARLRVSYAGQARLRVSYARGVPLRLRLGASGYSLALLVLAKANACILH
jgi:hypothetical protein